MLLGAPYLRNYASRTCQAASRDSVTPLQFNTNTGRFLTRSSVIEEFLSLNNEPVKIDNKAKFLGLVFDSKLNWREHITYLEEKCKKRLQLMRAVVGNTWGANKKVFTHYV